jgi:uncharacterized protein (TIGR00269 family)
LAAVDKCSICGAKARHFQRYSGRSYCGRCFTRSIRKRVRREILSNNLIKDGERILFAVSGGKDSLACLDIVHNLENKRSVDMAVLTIDEGIGGYRPEGIRAARKAAEEKNLDFHLISFSSEFGIGLDSMLERLGGIQKACTYCGVLRRWILNRYARELGADRLVTGHNLDDEAQSAMLNLIRGDPARLARSGPEYLLMHPKFIPRVKPLRGIPGKETLLYCLFSCLDVHTATCPYSEYDMRNEVRSFLNRMEENRPTSKSSFLSTTNRLASAIASRFEGIELRECEKCGEPTTGRMCKACQLLNTIA